MIVGPLQLKFPYNALKGLYAAADIARRFAATAGQMRARIVSGVGVYPLFNCAGGQTQNLTPCRGFDGFQIDVIGGTSSQQRIELSCDFDGQLLGQRIFFLTARLLCGPKCGRRRSSR